MVNVPHWPLSTLGEGAGVSLFFPPPLSELMSGVPLLVLHVDASVAQATMATTVRILIFVRQFADIQCSFCFFLLFRFRQCDESDLTLRGFPRALAPESLDLLSSRHSVRLQSEVATASDLPRRISCSYDFCGVNEFSRDTFKKST